MSRVSSQAYGKQSAKLSWAGWLYPLQHTAKASTARRAMASMIGTTVILAA